MSSGVQLHNLIGQISKIARRHVFFTFHIVSVSKFKCQVFVLFLLEILFSHHLTVLVKDCYRVS